MIRGYKILGIKVLNPNHYLGRELDIQDQVKDCGINDGFDEELEQKSKDKDPMDVIYCTVNKPCETCPKYPDECVDK